MRQFLILLLLITAFPCLWSCNGTWVDTTGHSWWSSPVLGPLDAGEPTPTPISAPATSPLLPGSYSGAVTGRWTCTDTSASGDNQTDIYQGIVSAVISATGLPILGEQEAAVGMTFVGKAYWNRYASITDTVTNVRISGNAVMISSKCVVISAGCGGQTLTGTRVVTFTGSATPR